MAVSVGKSIAFQGVIMQRSFFPVGLVGLAVLTLSTILIMVNPSQAGQLPAGFSTPILAFEFASSPQEVLDLFGHQAGPNRETIVARIDLGNRIDFAYMLSYTAFLGLFAWLCWRQSRQRWFWLPLALAAVVLAADALENVQLLAITAQLATGGFEPELGRLQLFTWIKWGGIAAIFLSLIPFMRQQGVFGKIISSLAVLNAGLALAALVHRSALNEIYALSVALVFVLLIVFAFLHRAPQGDKI